MCVYIHTHMHMYVHTCTCVCMYTTWGKKQEKKSVLMFGLKMKYTWFNLVFYSEKHSVIWFLSQLGRNAFNNYGLKTMKL